MEIRDERVGDEDAIRRLHREAFGGDFEVRLVELLRERGKAIVSLVAVEAGDVVGHVLFSPVTVDGSQAPRALGLAPVGVLPAFQGRGIGSSLIREGLRLSVSASYDVVVLIGAPGYYTRFGFQAGTPLGLANEYGVNDEFMVLELRKGTLHGVSGLVRYAREFAEAEAGPVKNGK
jgi:putative acetyltransferase